MRTYTYSQIAHIALPILVSTLMEQLIGTTDTAFLGRVGDIELGASAIGSILFITRVRDKILKSKEQKTIQPTKGGHKMVTYQNYVSLFYCQITSCPSEG
ncbi:MAG: hypothetical protein PUK53_00310, partial [Prevotellamassilia timonensis]|nr:hypothetical protein [Prevotellamassilia timonensis]